MVRAGDGWRRHLRRDIGWLLLFKLAALLFLRALFFSGDERPPADAAHVAARLAVSHAPEQPGEGRAP
jgi:hypothetical protein